MSPRQYTLMGEFINKDYSRIECCQFNQTTFGSCFHNQWIEYYPRRDAFSVTKAGRDAYYAYGTQNILRQVAKLTLTHYFIPPPAKQVGTKQRGKERGKGTGKKGKLILFKRGA